MKSLNTEGAIFVGEPDRRLIRETLVRLLGERYGVVITRDDNPGRVAQQDGKSA